MYICTDLVYLGLLISAVICLALHLHTLLQATTVWAGLGRELCLGVEQSIVNKPGCGVLYASPRDWGMVPQEFLAQGEWGEHDQAACHVLYLLPYNFTWVWAVSNWVLNIGEICWGGAGGGGDLLWAGWGWWIPRSRMQSHRMQSNAFYHHLEMQFFPQRGYHGADPATQVW